jgi:hypothetical protein
LLIEIKFRKQRLQKKQSAFGVFTNIYEVDSMGNKNNSKKRCTKISKMRFGEAIFIFGAHVFHVYSFHGREYHRR